jgi:hypothetical protein
MEARVTWFDVQNMECAIKGFELAMDPIEALPGNRGAMVLTNSRRSKALGLSFWDSPQALKDSDLRSSELREVVAGEGLCAIRDVETYHVALSMRRPPRVR